MITIGFVVQRYGREVIGGSESLARDLAERLVREGFRVVVFTTCARDYLTWRNEYPAGESLLRGVTIRRFPVRHERNIDDFNRFSERFFAAAAVDRDEREWLEAQGPFCPDLVDALAAAQGEIDLFFFFTYLYYPTVIGSGVVRQPLVLFPTAHDEAPIYLEAMKKLFARPRALFFLTQAEMELTQRLFSPTGSMRLVRTGIDIPSDVSDKAFRRKHLLVAPYLLFAGRIEKGKGLEAVFDYYRALKYEAYVELVLIGKKLMDVPVIQGVKYLGYVSEADKLAAFKGALFSLQPSPLESLSITTLESFSNATPVLVNRRCAALLEHVDMSGGGLAYDNQEEFLAAFRRLYRRPVLRAAMGAKGLEYVKKYYSWDAVLTEIKKGIGEVLSLQAQPAKI
ncbi:MAG: glycosyltransferase family 4 protein [Candidatus Aminicenantes bacterium]|nr:glycosyltransferase family 4 protein [Candidatus Aminicenantes bacterium]